MPERMHVVVQQAFGGPEVLELAEVDRPVPLATEVLVRVKAVGVNPVEPLIRSGRFPLIGQPPFILGWDISGVIEHLEGVTRFDIGDEVHGIGLVVAGDVACNGVHQYISEGVVWLGARELLGG